MAAIKTQFAKSLYVMSWYKSMSREKALLKFIFGIRNNTNSRNGTKKRKIEKISLLSHHMMVGSVQYISKIIYLYKNLKLFCHKKCFIKNVFVPVKMHNIKSRIA